MANYKSHINGDDKVYKVKSKFSKNKENKLLAEGYILHDYNQSVRCYTHNTKPNTLLTIK